MPVQSVALFLFSIFASALMLGLSFALKSTINHRFLDYYFYFIVSVVCYGFINWIGPSFIIIFSELGIDKSNSSIMLFIAAALPAALIKLYLFVIFLLGILDITINRRWRQTFYLISAVIVIALFYVLILDAGSEDLKYSRSFLTLSGVLILVANFVSLFYFLARTESFKNKQLQHAARSFGWCYLLGYFLYASPYYLSYYFDLFWYGLISPYLYYALHLIPIWFLKQYCQLRQQISPEHSIQSPDLSSLADKFDISKRELAILQLIMKGKNNNEIAELLFISPNTVRNHIYNIYGKTQVKNRIQLRLLCDNNP